MSNTSTYAKLFAWTLLTVVLFATADAIPNALRRIAAQEAPAAKDEAAKDEAGKSDDDPAAEAPADPEGSDSLGQMIIKGGAVGIVFYIALGIFSIQAFANRQGLVSHFVSLTTMRR